MLRLYSEDNPSYVIPQSFLKQNPSGPTGPVTVWHACCSRLPLRWKCWGYEGGHRGPPDNPPSAKKSSRRTESNRSERRHIVQIIYGWNSVHLKLRWNARSFPTCRGISLSSVACSMCTMFHPDIEIQCFESCLYINSNSFGNIDLERDPKALIYCALWCLITSCRHSYQNIRFYVRQI